MTERALPSVGGVRARRAAELPPMPRTVERTGTAVRPLVATHEAVLTTPARAGILLGASAAVYAVALAGVAGLQSAADAATSAARAPYLLAIAELRGANDALEARVQAAADRAVALVDEYEVAGLGLAAYQARLDELAALVSEVEGSAAALPARIRLPSVSIRGPVTVSRGSAGGGGGSSSGTSARTGASGG